MIFTFQFSVALLSTKLNNQNVSMLGLNLASLKLFVQGKNKVNIFFPHKWE